MHKQQHNMEQLDINHVVATMKKFVASQPDNQRNIATELEFLYGLLSPANIRMRFEAIEEKQVTDIKTSDESSDLTSTDLDDDSEKPTAEETLASEIINSIFDYSRGKKNSKKNSKQQSRVLDEPHFSFDNVDIDRIILTNNRNHSRFEHPIAFQANGIVLSSKTWDIVSMPPAAFNPRVNKKEVIAGLASYKIYRILDGTTVTLYHYNDEWVMSSTNGYAVESFKWMGSTTYMEAFMETLPKFDFDQLDKTHCYSIGFRNKRFHPFAADLPTAWLIRNYDLVNKCDVVDEEIGVPMQRPVTRRSICDTVDADDFYANMLSINEKSLDIYISRLIENTKKIPSNDTLDTIACEIAHERNSKLMNPSVHYGFILRREIAADDYNSNIMLESTLFKKIRQFVYNLPKGERMRKLKARGVVIDESNRLNYCMLRNYLDRSNRDTFVRLFPGFFREYQRYDELFATIVDNIITNGNSRKRTTTPTKQSVVCSRIAVVLRNHIEQQITIDPHNADIKSIVYDFAVDPQYIDLYFAVLYRITETSTD